MSASSRLAWYARRLASMSPPELAHRLRERAFQFADAQRRWGWEQFDLTGAIDPLPALDPERAARCLTSEVEEHARAILRGEIHLLSARWPKPDAPDWWTTDTWTLDPISRQHWPGRGAPASRSAYRHAHGFGDVKFVWELNRLQFLMPLAVAARRDQDQALADKIAAILAGWMESNPPFDGIHWTNGIEAASRLVVALFVHTMLGPLTPATLQAQLKLFVAAHAWMLARYPSLFSSANNHRIAELSGLYLAYLCAPSLPGAAAGVACVRRGLESEIGKQFHADGIGAEQSPTYAAYSLEWFLLAAVCGEAVGAPFSEVYAQRLRDAASALRWMMDDNGRTPAIGDDDEGRVCALGPAEDYLYPAAVCATASRWLRDAASAPPPQASTLLDTFVAAPTPTPDAPSGRRIFAEGGHSVWRNMSTRGTVLLAFDHGPLGFLSIAAHGHADALSIWLHVGGEPVIVDAGTFLYHTDGDARDRFRGTLAHNTLSLDGADQSQIAGPFNWSRHAKARVRDTTDAITAEHDGYLASHGVRHVRSVGMEGGRIRIADALEGDLRAPTAWSAGFTFHPNSSVTQTEDGVEARLPSGLRLRIQVATDASLALTPAEISPGFGKAAPTQRLIISGQAERAGQLAVTTIEILD